MGSVITRLATGSFARYIPGDLEAVMERRWEVVPLSRDIAVTDIPAHFAAPKQDEPEPDDL